jgi:hypothetical protein
LFSRDIERMLLNNNSTLMRKLRQSDLRHGRTMACKSNPTVDHQTSALHLLSNPDGGNCSDIKDNSLSMKEEKLWMFKEELMPRTETFKLQTKMERSNNNGKLSMLMSIQESQLRENLMKNSDSMLIEISTLFQS